MSATGGHQLAAPALLQVPIHPLLLKAFSDIETMGSIPAELQMAMEIQGVLVHI